ncbi:hypothetical protein BRAS3843_330025 [Bradyrhizobium sp. STM 3843]|uniref:hypothetical protein n=1 Tax=Bradyrhizobium sp. STM 3843 TaxID=551947 RepID=UPI0002403822|nr:hypothetical protein [Bradyrhizobium sp. STM 3843]CCE09657.1 hypothetical protein BRAS3843_330025 [Bradyrhizobium sp. STM 3843]
MGCAASSSLTIAARHIFDSAARFHENAHKLVDGGFLANGHPLSQPPAVDAHWQPLAAQNRGRFQVPTLRNVDKRPSLSDDFHGL